VLEALVKGGEVWLYQKPVIHMPMLVKILQYTFTVKTPYFVKFQVIEDSRRKGRKLVMPASLTTNYTAGPFWSGRIAVVV
jgi:hypothetical protein